MQIDNKIFILEEEIRWLKNKIKELFRKVFK